MADGIVGGSNPAAWQSNSATVATSETTTSTSFADLTTTTDTITLNVGPSGLALVIVTADLVPGGASGYCIASFAASGTNTIAAADTNAIIAQSSAVETAASWAKLYTGLAPGATTFKMKYRVVSGTGTFKNRSISVILL